MTDLGNLRRISEGVRQPEDSCRSTKLVQLESLAQQELSDQTFTIGNIGIIFDPRASNWQELVGRVLLFDLLEDFGVVQLQPFELLHLGSNKDIFGVLVGDFQLSRPGSHDLTLGLCKGPQPCSIDVTVANGVHIDSIVQSAIFLVDDIGVNIVTQKRPSKSSALCNRVDVVGVEGVHDLVTEVCSLIFLPAIGQLSGSIR